MSTRGPERLNPYIATTDVMVGLVLVFVLMMMFTVIAGQIDVSESEVAEEGVNPAGLVFTHVDRMDAVARATAAMPAHLRPVRIERNDPVGTQRWRFTGARLFVPGTIELTPDGAAAIEAFGEVLASVPTWRRVRVEGHGRRTLQDVPEDWEGSVLRATAVVRVLVNAHGGQQAQPWRFAVAGRGGQDPVVDAPEQDERVEIVLEFCEGAQCAPEELRLP